MEAVTAYDHLKKAGDIADKVLQKYNKPGDPLWEALLQVSNERIEHDNNIGVGDQNENHQT